MNKGLFILVFLLTVKGHIIAQSSAFAIATATVETPVGAETPGDLYLTNSVSDNLAGINMAKKHAGILSFFNEKMTTSYLKVIGGSFTYDVTLQAESVIPGKDGNIMKLTMFHMHAIMQDPDIARIPIGATVTSNGQPAENYKASFKVTINFN